MVSVHDRLKDWLITFGQEKKFEAWTTDRKDNVEFSKFRNMKVDYRPDVVWKYKGREKLFFELIFQEDFRQVVGEMLPASQVEGFTKMYFIRPTSDEPFWRNIEKFLRYTFKNEEGVVKVRHRPSFIIFPCSWEKDKKEDEIKERIIQTLVEDRWIKREEQWHKGKDVTVL